MSSRNRGRRRPPAGPPVVVAGAVAAVLLALVVATVVLPRLGDVGRNGAERITVVPAPYGPVPPDAAQVTAMKDRQQEREARARRGVERELRNRLAPGADRDRVDGPARAACRGIARAAAGPAPDTGLLQPVARLARQSGHPLISAGGDTLGVLVRHFPRDAELLTEAVLAMAQHCAKAGLGPSGPDGVPTLREDPAAREVCRRATAGRPPDHEPAGAEEARRLWSLARYSMVPDLMPHTQAVRSRAEAGQPAGAAYDRLARRCRTG